MSRNTQIHRVIEVKLSEMSRFEMYFAPGSLLSATIFVFGGIRTTFVVGDFMLQRRRLRVHEILKLVTLLSGKYPVLVRSNRY
jgi:hypothetical protein